MDEYLVIQLARIGDLIQSKRLVLSLARQGRVHLALDRGLEAFARLIYPFAELHPLRAHAGGVKPAEVLRDNAQTFAALKEVDFQAVYNLNRSNLSLCLCAIFPSETVWGYRWEKGQAVASTWSKIAARWTGERRTSPLNLVDFWGYFHPAPIAPAEVNPPARPKNLGPGARQRLGIVLAGRESRRSLPAEYLARAVEALFAARKGPEIILIGSGSEQEAARKVKRHLRPATLQRVEDLSGKTSLADLHDLFQGLDLLFTPDTGAMHLAAHLGLPVMACFLSSAWVYETGPYGLGHVIWQATASGHSGPNCAPCLETAPCPHKVTCLAPFASPAWLDHLAGRNNGTWPGGLLGLVSRLDDLGVDYSIVDGQEVESRQEYRQGKRSLLKEYLGLPKFDDYAPPPPVQAVEKLFRENDWILPDYF